MWSVTPMSVKINGVEVLGKESPGPSTLDLARDDAKAFHERVVGLNTALNAVGTLLGDTVAHAIESRSVGVEDAGAAALSRYERAVGELQDLVEQLRTDVAEARQASFAAEAVLASAMLDAERRAARTKTGRLPEWHARAASVLGVDRIKADGGQS